MIQKTVAEIFVETLVAAGVIRIYGVVGVLLSSQQTTLHPARHFDTRTTTLRAVTK